MESKILFGSSSGRVSNSLAVFLNLDRTSWILHNSRLLRRPYSPTIFNSESKRSFSKGRLGFLKVLPSVVKEEKKNKNKKKTREESALCSFRFVSSYILPTFSLSLSLSLPRNAHTQRNQTNVLKGERSRKKRFTVFQTFFSNPFFFLGRKGRKRKKESALRREREESGMDTSLSSLAVRRQLTVPVIRDLRHVGALFISQLRLSSVLLSLCLSSFFFLLSSLFSSSLFSFFPFSTSTSSRQGQPPPPEPKKFIFGVKDNSNLNI